MQSSKRSRVTRKQTPPKPIKRTRYGNALPLLLKDFDGRCAYSMQHIERVGRFQVDHFDPRKKKDLIQSYDNLFPSTEFCNKKKGNTWPTGQELKAGCRFLNPCLEVDYGEQIFEDPNTHHLFGTTVAAKWHIRVLGLNADHLVSERKKRYENWLLINKHTLKVKPGKDIQGFLEISTAFRNEVELMIPPIPAKK